MCPFQKKKKKKKKKEKKKKKWNSASIVSIPKKGGLSDGSNY